MGVAKIRLSETEREIVQDTSLILTKNAVLQKVQQLLSALQQQQHSGILANAGQLPREWVASSPKISRGENYKGLPYFMLDYPRVFAAENIAAMRTMFWWGHFFSVTLHLSGTYKIQAEKKMEGLLPILEEQGFYIGVNENPWEHHFENDNFKKLSTLARGQQLEYILSKSFLKIAQPIPLADWDDAPLRLQNFFDQLLLLLVD